MNCVIDDKLSSRTDMAIHFFKEKTLKDEMHEKKITPMHSIILTTFYNSYNAYILG